MFNSMFIQKSEGIGYSMCVYYKGTVLQIQERYGRTTLSEELS